MFIQQEQAAAAEPDSSQDHSLLSPPESWWGGRSGGDRGSACGTPTPAVLLTTADSTPRLSRPKRSSSSTDRLNNWASEFERPDRRDRNKRWTGVSRVSSPATDTRPGVPRRETAGPALWPDGRK